MKRIVLVCTVIALSAENCLAAVVKYSNKAAWQSVAGAYSTIDFTGFSEFTFVTDQYAPMGVTFLQGNDYIAQSNSLANDTWGLRGNLDDTITVIFDSPILQFAIEHPGTEAIKLYSNGELLFDTGMMGGSGTGFFSGVVSTIPFDTVVLYDPGPPVSLIDDLHFGAFVPAPGALALLAAAFALSPRRRRAL